MYAVPSVAFNSPVNILNVVVLPAPFKPSRLLEFLLTLYLINKINSIKYKY
jgi:hypothetical protein